MQHYMMDCLFRNSTRIARARLNDKVVKTVNAFDDRGAIAESKKIAGTCGPSYFRVRRVAHDQDAVIYDSREDVHRTSSLPRPPPRL